MRKEPSASVIRAWCDAVDENGQRLITLRQLLKAFGYQRRSSASLTSISRYLEEKGLYVDVPDGIDIDASVPLTAEPVRRIGELYEREADLERRFPGGIMRRVGLERVVSRQYSPRGTRDKLDFLCLDNDGRSVVVELKAGPGDKRAVEQVLRYIGVLKKEGGHKEPRGVLITGVGDLHTRRALEGRQADDHIRWWVYGLRGSRILLEEIDTRPAPSPRVAASTPRPPKHALGHARFDIEQDVPDEVLESPRIIRFSFEVPMKMCPGCFAILSNEPVVARHHVRTCPKALKLPTEKRRPVSVSSQKDAWARKRAADPARRKKQQEAARVEQKAAREAEDVARRAEQKLDKRLRKLLDTEGTTARRSRDVDERGERSQSVDAIPVPFETNRRRH